GVNPLQSTVHASAGFPLINATLTGMTLINPPLGSMSKRVLIGVSIAKSTDMTPTPTNTFIAHRLTMYGNPENGSVAQASNLVELGNVDGSSPPDRENDIRVDFSALMARSVFRPLDTIGRAVFLSRDNNYRHW